MQPWLLLSFKVKSLSRVRLFATPWTVAYEVHPSMEFSRQEYCLQSWIIISIWYLVFCNYSIGLLHLSYEEYSLCVYAGKKKSFSHITSNISTKCQFMTFWFWTQKLGISWPCLYVIWFPPPIWKEKRKQIGI